MPSRITACILFLLAASPVDGAESKTQIRKITEAESVLCIFAVDHGLRSDGGPALVVVAWPDGQVVWSHDRTRGGAPYRVGKIDPDRVNRLLTRFENDGLFEDDNLKCSHFGPDSQFVTILAKSAAKQVRMESWHEPYEESGKVVATKAGLTSLEGRNRFDVLSHEPGDYRHFRLAWNEIRCRLIELIPDESSGTAGVPVMRAGKLFWKEP